MVRGINIVDARTSLQYFWFSVKCIDACRVKRIALTKLSTGKSIGEHLDAAIEERYDIDNGVLLEW